MNIFLHPGKVFLLSQILLILSNSFVLADDQDLRPLKIPSSDISKQYYFCNYISDEITIDGVLDDIAWNYAEWTNDFIDIEGVSKESPYYKTRSKLLWNDEYLFICADLEEEHIWATLKEKDSIVYFDNDFEVFIDPDKDSHNYVEIELNAFNTVWDLILLRPYRDKGPVTNSYDLKGLKTAVNTNGTLNNPHDKDKGWTVEIAIPWTTLFEIAGTNSPPLHGDTWHINFSRVQWETGIIDGKYVKKTDHDGNTVSEHNWVWSPHGIINMHYPEQWGVVIFNRDNSELEEIKNEAVEEEKYRDILRKYYYAERNYYFNNQGVYTGDIANLIPFLEAKYIDFAKFISLYVSPSDFEIIYRDSTQNQSWHISSDGELWNSPN